MVSQGKKTKDEKVVKYVCSNNSEHEFDSMSADGFCSKEECYGIYPQTKDDKTLCILSLESF